jgi:hypothetical protein
VARQLGGGNRLPEAAVDRLLGLRASYGYPAPSCVACPDCGSQVDVGAGDRLLMDRGELLELITDAVRQLTGERT